MIAPFPDNAINTELYNRLNNLDVNGTTFKFYVKQVTSDKQKFYFLKSTQLNQPDFTKCGTGYINSTEIQVVAILPKNSGSELILNNAVAALFTELEDFNVSGALNVSKVELSVDNDLTEDIGGDIVYRKIVRMELTIN